MKTRDAKSYDCAVGCPVEATLDLIDGKWKGVRSSITCWATPFASMNSDGGYRELRNAC